jgi:signal transduction histidine kinase
MSAATEKAVRPTAQNDRRQPRDRGADAQRETADGSAGMLNEAQHVLTEDHDRIAHDVNDTIVHQIFAVSLDLNAALSHMDHDVDDHLVAEKVRHAITGLDQAIRDLRNAVIELNDPRIRRGRSRLCGFSPEGHRGEAAVGDVGGWQGVRRTPPHPGLGAGDRQWGDRPW